MSNDSSDRAREIAGKIDDRRDFSLTGCRCPRCGKLFANRPQLAKACCSHAPRISEHIRKALQTAVRAHLEKSDDAAIRARSQSHGE